MTVAIITSKGQNFSLAMVKVRRQGVHRQLCLRTINSRAFCHCRASKADWTLNISQRRLIAELLGNFAAMLATMHQPGPADTWLLHRLSTKCHSSKNFAMLHRPALQPRQHAPCQKELLAAPTVEAGEHTTPVLPTTVDVQQTKTLH